MDPVSFVKSLELADIKSKHVLSSKGKLFKPADKKKEGYVDCGSLASFTENLTGQNKEDVLNSTLLAQLAANYKHDRNTDPDEWYKVYHEVLMNVGWIVQEFHFTDYESTQSSFEISKVVVELLVELVGEEEAGLVDVVKKTLDALKNSGSETIKLFGSNSSSPKNGNFQIIPCNLDKSGQVVVAFIVSYFKASKVEHDYLFFSYKTADIKLKKSTDVFTLDEVVYAKVRQAIIDKLGEKAKTFVNDLKI